MIAFLFRYLCGWLRLVIRDSSGGECIILHLYSVQGGGGCSPLPPFLLRTRV